MRVRHEGAVFDVIGVMPDGRRRREFLTLVCRAGVNAG